MSENLPKCFGSHVSRWGCPWQPEILISILVYNLQLGANEDGFSILFEGNTFSTLLEKFMILNSLKFDKMIIFG